MGKRKVAFLTILILLVTLTFVFSQNLAEFEKKVTELSLIHI